VCIFWRMPRQRTLPVPPVPTVSWFRALRAIGHAAIPARVLGVLPRDVALSLTKAVAEANAAYVGILAWTLGACDDSAREAAARLGGEGWMARTIRADIDRETGDVHTGDDNGSSRTLKDRPETSR